MRLNSHDYAILVLSTLLCGTSYGNDLQERCEKFLPGKPSGEPAYTVFGTLEGSQRCEGFYDPAQRSTGGILVLSTLVNTTSISSTLSTTDLSIPANSPADSWITLQPLDILDHYRVDAPVGSKKLFSWDTELLKKSDLAGVSFTGYSWHRPPDSSSRVFLPLRLGGEETSPDDSLLLTVQLPNETIRARWRNGCGRKFTKTGDWTNLQSTNSSRHIIRIPIAELPTYVELEAETGRRLPTDACVLIGIPHSAE